MENLLGYFPDDEYCKTPLKCASLYTLYAFLHGNQNFKVIYTKEFSEFFSLLAVFLDTFLLRVIISDIHVTFHQLICKESWMTCLKKKPLIFCWLVILNFYVSYSKCSLSSVQWQSLKWELEPHTTFCLKIATFHMLSLNGG